MTTIKNLVLGQNVSDFHTGYRAYTRKVLEAIPFMNNFDAFVFDTEFLLQADYCGFRIGSVPVRYFSEASSIDFKNSTVYGLKTLGALLFCYILWCHLAAQYSCLLLIRINTLASLLLLTR